MSSLHPPSIVKTIRSLIKTFDGPILFGSILLVAWCLESESRTRGLSFTLDVDVQCHWRIVRVLTDVVPSLLYLVQEDYRG